DGMWYLVADGRESQACTSVLAGSIAFAPGKGAVAACVVGIAGGVSVDVDGSRGPVYDVILTRKGGKIVFDSASAFHYLAVRGSDVLMVSEKLTP
ncbi:MAG TPA: hypothetical protein VJO14_07205, partial [Bacteroidota bacterium]|nr:hypothetical protein [Bacteroidota bacterium]